MSCGKTRVSAYAVCAREGRLLFVHQSAPGPAQGSWTLPGGDIGDLDIPDSGEIDAVEWHPIANLPEPTTQWAQLGALLAAGREPV